jgi:hypothetical protein
MQVFDMYGNKTMEAESLERDGEQLIMKATAFGSMPMTMYLRPEELWSMTKLLSWPIALYLPVMLLKGWLRSRKKKD